MRCVPGSIRTVLFERATRLSGTSMAALPAVIMFFDGVMPDKDTIKTQFAAGVGRQLGLYNVLNPKSANYMGGVGWMYGWNRVLSPNIDEIELALSYAGDYSSRNQTGTGAETDPLMTRQARIHRAGTPTWFAIALYSTGVANLNTDTIPVGNNTSQLYFAAVGTVGNEDSTADLKLVGGTLALTQGSPIDLSKAPVISNLKLRLR